MDWIIQMSSQRWIYFKLLSTCCVPWGTLQSLILLDSENYFSPWKSLDDSYQYRLFVTLYSFLYFPILENVFLWFLLNCALNSGSIWINHVSILSSEKPIFLEIFSFSCIKTSIIWVQLDTTTMPCLVFFSVFH